MPICSICNKSFISVQGLVSHERHIHKPVSKHTSTVLTNKELAAELKAIGVYTIFDDKREPPEHYFEIPRGKFDALIKRLEG